MRLPSSWTAARFVSGLIRVTGRGGLRGGVLTDQVWHWVRVSVGEGQVTRSAHVAGSTAAGQRTDKTLCRLGWQHSQCCLLPDRLHSSYALLCLGHIPSLTSHMLVQTAGSLYCMQRSWKDPFPVPHSPGKSWIFCHLGASFASRALDQKHTS